MDVLSSLLGAIGLLLVLILTVVLWIVVSIYRTHARYAHLPGPKRTSFLFGNTWEMGATTRRYRDAIELPKDVLDADNNIIPHKLKPITPVKFLEWCDTFGDTYAIYLIHRVLVVTRSPDALKTILVNGDQKLFAKSEVIKARWLFSTRYMGDGLATEVNHDAWYIRRKMLDPVFHRTQLRLAFDTFNLTSDHLMKELGAYAESGETVTMAPIIHRSTLDVIMRSMFSMDSAHLTSEFHEIAHQFTIETFEALQMSFIPFIEYNPMYYKFVKKIKMQIQEFRAVGAQLVEERITLVKTHDDAPNDLLTTLVKAHLEDNEVYTKELMIDEFVTVVIAGMETSANTLLFILMELGRRPDLTERLVAEVDEVVGNKSFISSDDITKFSFMTTLIKETLRLYPPAAGIIRVTSAPTELDGYHIPENTTLLLSLLGGNRHPKYVKDPTKFDPDRFDPRAENRVPAYSFLSFSLGSRNCIGQVFAQMEMKVMLAKLIQHYHIKLDKTESFTLGTRATLFPISNIKCTIVERTH